MSAGTVKLVSGLASGVGAKAPILSKTGLRLAAGKAKSVEGVTSLASAFRAPRAAAEVQRQSTKES